MRRLPLLGGCLLLGLGLSSRAGAVTFGASVEQRGFGADVPEAVLRAQLRYPDLVDPARSQRLRYQLRGAAHVEGRPRDALGLRLGLDTGLLELGGPEVILDGRNAADQVARTGLLGATWAEWQAGEDGALLVRAGKYRGRVAEGAVFDAYGFGLLADLDLGLALPAHPWRARLQVLLPSGAFEADTFASPLFQASVGYRVGPGFEARGFGAVYLDRGAVGPVFEDALVRGQADAIDEAFEPIQGLIDRNPCPADGEPTNRRQALSCLRPRLIAAANRGDVGYATDTRGHLGWTGAWARAGGDDWSVHGLLVYGFGEVDLTFVPNGALTQAYLDGLTAARGGDDSAAQEVLARLTRQRRISISSWLAQLTAKWRLHPDVELDGFALAVSGDGGLPANGPDTVDYRGFMSLAPLLAHTSLFFGGGAATAVASPNASAIAPDAAGLLAGGLGVTAFLGERWRARAVVAAMSAIEPNAAGARFEGVEVDAIVDALITDWLLAFGDAAVFVPGAYFGEVGVGVQVIVGAQARLP